MNRKQALQEANRRWGSNAYVRESRNPKLGAIVAADDATKIPACSGLWGTGKTFEEAFADADRRESLFGERKQ